MPVCQKIPRTAQLQSLHGDRYDCIAMHDCHAGKRNAMIAERALSGETP